jgi:hypothetical protein
VLLQPLNAEKFGANGLGLIEKNVIGRFGRRHCGIRYVRIIIKGKNCRGGLATLLGQYQSPDANDAFQFGRTYPTVRVPAASLTQF